jgi:Holliday junction resolvase
MKPETMMIDDVKYVRKTLKQLGYKTTSPRHKNHNGIDIFAIKEDHVMSVEIKTACKIKGKNALRVRRVEHNRKNDDLIAIVHPTGYVLIEQMKDHLKNCNKTGDRYLTF